MRCWKRDVHVPGHHTLQAHEEWKGGVRVRFVAGETRHPQFGEGCVCRSDIPGGTASSSRG